MAVDFLGRISVCVHTTHNARSEWVRFDEGFFTSVGARTGTTFRKHQDVAFLEWRHYLPGKLLITQPQVILVQLQVRRSVF
mmetsp:Transcript_32263/g.40453  ORF Transcript_32263/g.40453 Transcript_32263/m.40453 type:complete len:81 (-) Transcript_32263:709-951(-)